MQRIPLIFTYNVQCALVADGCGCRLKQKQKKKTSTNYFNLNVNSAFLFEFQLQHVQTFIEIDHQAIRSKKRNFYLTNDYNKVQNMRFRFVDLLCIIQFHIPFAGIKYPTISVNTNTNTHFPFFVSMRSRSCHYECISWHGKEFFNGRLKMRKLNSVANGRLRFLIEKSHYFSEYFWVWALSYSSEPTNSDYYSTNQQISLVTNPALSYSYLMHSSESICDSGNRNFMSI